MDQQGGSLVCPVFGESAGCQVHGFTPVFHEQGAGGWDHATMCGQGARLVEATFQGGQVAGRIVNLAFEPGRGMRFVSGFQRIQLIGEPVMFGGQAGQKLIGMDFGEHEMGSASECLFEPAIVVFVAGREAASSCGSPFDVHERAKLIRTEFAYSHA